MGDSSSTTRKPRTTVSRKRKEQAGEVLTPVKKNKKGGGAMSKDKRPGDTLSMAVDDPIPAFVKSESVEKAKIPIKPEPKVKQEGLEPGLESFPAAPFGSDVSTTDGSAILGMPDSLPEIFSIKREPAAEANIDPALTALAESPPRITQVKDEGGMEC
ncbi:MAG: hypothetical protein Q9219_000603 [cf. Caloplaca sp. 3 TL-2023]